uniref:Ferredoxin-type protein NapH n=1 Tax=Candidatus Kentrum sp. LFY TaxID=2126342 RepID=A0A450UD20_9GAMM|nr:MAG: ferredoxin-type protein NapH [Candidatus Kentron sp. LFY]VFK19040.1 MAG: ferredoxin-type protein NapH [Candidatus Kentron sp. LFY]
METANSNSPTVEERGWLRTRKWLLLRRASQLSILGLFLLGPWFGIWIITGNLSASLLLGEVPMTDPHAFLQTLAAGHWPAAELVAGVIIVVSFYGIIGGRVFCAWVCPVNLVTDAAAALRRHFGLKGGANLSRSMRYWLLAATLLLALVTGELAWETVNPVTITHRGLIFGMGVGWLVVFGVFLFDLSIAGNGWCGRLCPTGALYALVGKKSLVRVRAERRDACNDCLDCFVVCPEPNVITPALKGAPGGSDLIESGACTNCGRCIDVCGQEVFRMGTRFGKTTKGVNRTSGACARTDKADLKQT